MVDPHTVPVFTLNNGLTIPAIGMGTFGSDRVTPDEVAGAVAGALRTGWRLFDCAACYGNEAQIGAAFQEAVEEGVVQRSDYALHSLAFPKLPCAVLRREFPESGFQTLLCGGVCGYLPPD